MQIDSILSYMNRKIILYIVYNCIKPYTIKPNTMEWTMRPVVVGQPDELARVPTMPPRRLSVSL